jgi:hypothetical protein
MNTGEAPGQRFAESAIALHNETPPKIGRAYRVGKVTGIVPVSRALRCRFLFFATVLKIKRLVL